MRFKIGEKDILISILRENFRLGNIKSLNKISINSNITKKDDIFIAIKGQNTDGHLFINDAINNGAKIIISSKKVSVPQNISLIITKSTKSFIINLAKLYRQKFEIDMIAITGTNGKTTTKELLFEIMNNKFNSFKNKGNYNSTIGLPLSLFGITKNIEYGIIEIGASKVGEIDILSKLVNPVIGLITNISTAHLDTFKSFDNIIKTKLELFNNIKKNGHAVKNFDDINIRNSKSLLTDVSYGYNCNADYKAKCELENNTYKITINDNQFIIKNNSYSVVANFIAVYVIAKLNGISNKIIQKSINSFIMPQSRGEMIKVNNATLIDDSYNANFQSMKLGIEWISNLPGYNKKIAVLGEMKELGDLAIGQHKSIGGIISSSKINYILCFGEQTKHIINNISNEKIFKFYFKSKYDLISYLKSIISKGDLIYLKGSRSNELETIIKDLK